MQKRLQARARAVNIWLMAPLLGLAVFLVIFIPAMAPVQAASSSNLNFQARLLGSNGTIVADGNYNIDFKLYNADSTTGTVGTCSGACLWEETRKNSNSQGVQVINGYFSVNLGSVTPFPAAINWDQQLWLTMNIGGTTTGSSVTWDGEMQNAGHSIALTALPYAFSAGQLATGTGTSRGTLKFAALGQATDITLPDPGASTATVCYQNDTNCGFMTGSSANFVQLAQGVQNDSSTTNSSIFINKTGATANILQLQKSSVNVMTVNNSGQLLLGQAGTGGLNGSLVFNTTNASNAAITISASASTTASYNLTLPTSGPTTNQCIQTDATTASQLKFNTCGNRTSTLVVAASNSSTALKNTADYVATGTDDATTINTALSALPSGGGTVYLAEGTYNLGATSVNVPNNTTLAGAGASTVLKFATNVGSGTYYAIKNSDTTGGTQVNVQNLLIDGGSQSAGVFYGIYFNGMGGSGRAGGSVRGVTVQNFRSGSSGIYLNSSSNNQIIGNTLASNVNWGLALNSSTNNTLSGNNAYGNGNGFVIIGGSSNTITGNTATSNTALGIYLFNTSYNTVTGNIATSNPTNGIAIQSSGNNVVSANKLHDNGGTTANNAIGISSATNNTVTANDISDSSCTTTCYAISIDSGSSRNYLSNNRYSGSAANTASISDASTTTIYANQQTNATNSTGDVSSLVVRGSANSATAFQIQNATGTNIFNVDTTNALIGTAATNAASVNSQDFNLRTGNAAGTTSNSGSLKLDVGTATGTAGSILIGTVNNASAITIGSTTQTSTITLGQSTATNTISIGAAAGASATQTINIGTSSTASSTTIVTIGSTIGASATTIKAGTGNLNLTPDGSSNTGVVVKPTNASTAAFQVQNSTNSKAVLTVDNSGNQLLLGTSGVGGITGGIKLFYAGSTGSISLVMSDPGSNNYTLTIPSGGGTICTTANALCSGGGGGTGSGLAKDAVDTSSADALAGYLYTFTNTGNAETGGVLSLDNGNNTGSALSLKATSTKAFQAQNSSGYNALVLDTSASPAHLKVYDGTATQAYADIYYDDSAGAAIFVASTGKTQIGGGSVSTLITAGTSQALNLTGHASSNWTLDSGDLTIDVTGTTPNLNIGTGATAKTITIGNQTGATAVNIKSGSGNINLNPVGTGNTGVIVKAQNASTLALQVQNSTSSKAVMSVDTSGNQVVLGDGSSGGINGQLAFSYAGASGEILLKPNASPGSSTFTLQLPDENGTLCTTAGSAACLAVYGGGTAGNFLAKDTVDTSGADSGSGYLYTFTNAGTGGSGGVLKLNNGNNTGSALTLTTTGNPDSGKAVIYAENKNASPSGNLLDLEAGATPSSVFNVDASGKVTAAGQLSVVGTTLDGGNLVFGDSGNPSVVQAATSQALNITANATSLWQVGGTDQNLTIQTSGTGTLAIDTTGSGTVDLGNTNATTIAVGGASGAITTIGGGDVAHTIHIGDGGASSAQTISIGSIGGASITTIAAGSGNINFNAAAAEFTEVTGTRTLGIQTRTTNVAGTNFVIQAGAGGSGATAVAGGSLSLIGGAAAGTGNANGGNLNLSGGAGVGSGADGLVLLSTPAFATTTNDPNCYTGGAAVSASCTIAQTSVDGSAAILVGFFNSGQTASLPNPTITTPGKLVYITAATGSQDFTLSVNGGGTGNEIAMRQNTSATMIWSGTVWTAAGASSSTTLQAAYDNTLQSAGGAELVVSHTSATNGLTIRDSITNPVNGTLLSVQAASASTLFSVNDSVAEYSSNGGAEIAGGTTSTFPSGTWSSLGGATVSRYTTAGNFVNTGQASVSVATTTAAGDGVANQLSSTLTANVHYNVSFAVRLASGTFPQMAVYYSVDGSAQSVTCTSGQTVPTSVWKKINCAFQAPSSGITATNAILIKQTVSGTARTFYVDNISVTIAADYNYATDGGVDDSANFATNWTAVAGSTVTRDTGAGNDASDSAKVVTTGAGQGIRNKVSINLLTNTLYRVSVYAASTTSGFDSFTVRYSRDGGTNFTDCADYNTQSVSSSITDFVQITCYITTDGTAATSPYVYFTQTDATGRTFYVDTFSITLTTNTAPNIQIGGGVNGGPVALLTLDRAASAPIAANNDALLGSMYYDTSLGKLQCYEADGWGACGSSPDNIVTISPEYTNAVMHGTGVGTMVSDICSSTLHINDGTSGQATICGSNETYNFYKWTSPQATAQTYSIYVTYQLPGTFKSFSSGQTSIMGRTDSSNATVSYLVYRNSSSTGLIACGPSVTVSSGSVSSWQTGVATGATDPSTCGFNPGESIVFKIDVTASQNADAYVGNLNFTFTNK